MKTRLLSLSAFLLLSACNLSVEGKPFVMDDFEGIYEGYQVVYSPSGDFFSTGGMIEDRMLLTKHTSPGTGSYSSYSYKGKEVLSLGSNFEFVKDGKFYASHNQDLTFSEISYQNGKFLEKKMTEDQVKALFPNAQLVKISDFQNGKIKVKKPSGQPIALLIFNDTNANFYKYSFDPSTVKKTDIAGLIEVSKRGSTVTFSHYGEDTKASPKYTIIVK